METIEVLCLCALNMFSFVMGAKIGQKTIKGETIETPKIPNPVKAIEEYKESKEYKEKQERFNNMMDNINNYDGTGLGQKDID